MAIWYEVKKNEKSINNFMDCNWGFHDFRPERVEFIPGKDMVEIFLKYDTMTEGVLLRFVWVHDLHVNTQRDYDAEWIYGSELIVTDDGNMVWVDVDDWDINIPQNLEKVKKFATYVEAERLMWAVTDAEGNPVELPEDRINQVWKNWNEVEEKHFELDEFSDNWNTILKPWYNR